MAFGLHLIIKVLQGTAENKNLSGKASIQAKCETKHFLNTNLEHYL
jgi:hypothetical protein